MSVRGVMRRAVMRRRVEVETAEHERRRIRVRGASLLEVLENLPEGSKCSTGLMAHHREH